MDFSLILKFFVQELSPSLILPSPRNGRRNLEILAYAVDASLLFIL